MHFSIPLMLSSLAVSTVAIAHPVEDSLQYRLNNTDAGQHPYIQNIFEEQFVTRNRLPRTALKCLKTVTADKPETSDITVFVNYDRGHQSMQLLANCFAQRTGISVEILVSPEGEDMAGNYEALVAAGNAPDVVFWAHDRAGEWAGKGYLRPVNPGFRVFNSVPVNTWEAAKIDGEYYGYPVAMESGAMIYNKDLLPVLPQTFAEFAALDLGEGVRSLEWDFANTYFSMGLLHANGGYSFQQTSNGWDATDIGVTNSGAVTGLQTIVDLVNSGVVDAQADYVTMMDGFLAGEVAAIINGPWSWKDISDAGINFAVAPLPSVAGSAASPFVGITTYLFSAESQHPIAAEAFVSRYLMSEEGIALIDQEWPLGGVLNMSYVLSDDTDALILDSLQAANAGTQMPNLSEMGAFWGAMGPAINEAVAGEKTAQQALNDAAASIAAAQ